MTGSGAVSGCRFIGRKLRGIIMFKYVLALLKNNIHKNPSEYQNEVDFVIEILIKGQGYLTKDKPVKVIFYDDHASK